MNFNNIINNIAEALNNPKDYMKSKRTNKKEDKSKQVVDHPNDKNAIAWDENGNPIDAYWDVEASIKLHCKKMGLKIKKL